MQIEYPLDIFTYPDTPLPDVWTVRQNFETPTLTEEQIEAQCRRAVAELASDPRLKQGARVAVGVGSRGLDNLVRIVGNVVRELKSRGLEPFVIPAMGSHGGATAEGQISVLRDYGITRESVGAEVRATMEVAEVGRLEGADAGDYSGQPIYCDRFALAADAILLINREKAHTDFGGEFESGIAKMSVIGLGKQIGAASVHRFGTRGLSDLMPRAARFLVKNLPIVGGIVLLENELGKTSEIHALQAAQIACAGEKELLDRARCMSPRLPFKELDVLIVDEMGKNISGAGMDTHVIGRGFMPSIPEHEWGGPNIRVVVVLDISAPSHGNAAGLGLADITTRRLIEKVSFHDTLTNYLTSSEGGVYRSRIPLIQETSEAAVKTAIVTCGRGDYGQIRLARIRSTADTRQMEISAALVEEARGNSGLTVSGECHALIL